MNHLSLTYNFVCLLVRYSKRAIYASMIMAIMICSIITVYFYLNHNVPTILFNNVEERQIYEDMATVYMPTYYHITPYLIGIITGYQIMRAKQEKIKIHRVS